MKLPKKFREDDIVVFQQNYVCPFGGGGTADISPGTPARIEKILYVPSRNQMFSSVVVTVVVAIMIGGHAEYLSMTMDWAQEVLEVKPAAKALYGNK